MPGETTNSPELRPCGLLRAGDPIPPGGCGCRQNGVPVMRAQCELHRLAPASEALEGLGATWRYASMLAGGNASIAMHALFMGKRSLTAAEFQNEIEASIYRALRQAFDERMGIKLPEQCDSEWEAYGD